MPAPNFIPVNKQTLDLLSGTNLRVELEYINGELKFIVLKTLPLNDANAKTFRLQEANFRSLMATQQILIP